MFKLSKSVYPLSKNLTNQAKTLVSIAIALPIISLTSCGVNTSENVANTADTKTAGQPVNTNKPVKL
ncbi:MAG: hypothetical protein ACRDB1_14865, partial [Microcoleaceae cyanobacterium]